MPQIYFEKKNVILPQLDGQPLDGPLSDGHLHWTVTCHFILHSVTGTCNSCLEDEVLTRQISRSHFLAQDLASF